MPPTATLDRAYGLLHIKALDAERRTFSGMASTPELDRQGHTMDPGGATYRNPIPLLAFHNQQSPLGTASLKRATPEGIAFEASIAHVTEAGALHDRLEEAWQSIKAGLITGVSIGWRPLPDGTEFLKNGGVKFSKYEIVELSIVTIPANMDTTILNVKTLAAASGPNPPGVTGLPTVRASKAAHAMTIKEQITQFENTRAAKAARQHELMTAAADASVTLDAPQTVEYDTLATEVKSIDAHLVRLAALETANLARATAITAAADPTRAGELRGATPIIQVKANVPPATGFVRLCQALAVCKGSRMEAGEYAKRWHDSTPEVELYLKAAVAAGTTTDATWAGPLAQLMPLTSEFIELLRPATLLGKIPGLRKVPFNVSIASQTGGGSYQWVGQGAPKPVGKLQFGSVTLAITKCAGIIVITEELAKVSSPSAEETIRQDMINGIAAFLDVEFTDPTKAAVANVSPGSITNGVTPITTTGTSPANARQDLQALLAALTAANISAVGAVLLMSESNALALGGALNALGQPLFPGMGVNGGTAMGLTVLASQAVGNNVILVQPTNVLYADDGGVTIDVSREASVQMDGAPDNPAVATTVLTSLWQNNLVGLRAERFINWKKARAGTVQYTVATYTT